MSYNVHITRAAAWYHSEQQPISAVEWLRLIAADPELSHQSPAWADSIDAAWTGPSAPPAAWFAWREGRIFTNHPDEPAIAKMIDLARQLQANVIGDGGEYYFYAPAGNWPVTVDLLLLQIVVAGRSIPDTTDDWDRDHLDVTISASLGEFNASVSTTILGRDLDYLARQLEYLYTHVGQQPAIQFRTLEYELQLEMWIDKLGHLFMRVDLRDDPAWNALLRLQFEADQMALPPMINSLRQALEQYPPIGPAFPLPNPPHRHQDG